MAKVTQHTTLRLRMFWTLQAIVLGHITCIFLFLLLRANSSMISYALFIFITISWLLHTKNLYCRSDRDRKKIEIEKSELFYLLFQAIALLVIVLLIIFQMLYNR